MTEVLKAATAYLFEHEKLHRIEANVMPEDGPSLRVLEKAGFQNESLSRKYLKIIGAWEDHVHMVLLHE